MYGYKAVKTAGGVSWGDHQSTSAEALADCFWKTSFSFFKYVFNRTQFIESYPDISRDKKTPKMINSD